MEPAVLQFLNFGGAKIYPVKRGQNDFITHLVAILPLLSSVFVSFPKLFCGRTGTMMMTLCSFCTFFSHGFIQEYDKQWFWSLRELLTYLPGNSSSLLAILSVNNTLGWPVSTKQCPNLTIQLYFFSSNSLWYKLLTVFWVGPRDTIVLWLLERRWGLGHRVAWSLQTWSCLTPLYLISC